MLALLLAAAPLLAAQHPHTATRVDTVSAACDGLRVGRVEIVAERPPFSGAVRWWRAAAQAVGLHHATTRDETIAAFLALEPGGPCTEFRRAESERILRAQPFLADASVRVVPDSLGTATVLVTTRDEVPVLVNASFRGVRPTAFSLGNANIFGTGLHLEGRVEAARSYRTGFGATLVQHALFGRPYQLTMIGERERIGHRMLAEVQHPFYTDLQRISWHAGIERRSDYLGLERPARDGVALRVRDLEWGTSGLLRVFGTRTVALLGGAVTGRRFDPADRGVVMSDTGFVADTGVALVNRYLPFRVGRIGASGGVRRVQFRSMSGIDALAGTQDVATGAMIGLFAAHGLPRLGERDLFFSGAMYAGGARDRMFVATLAQAEARRVQGEARWESIIGSARTALYWGSAPGISFSLADEFSGGTRSRLPLQLALGDREGGIRGYRSSSLAGARRNVVRSEVRWSGASRVRRADVGVAVFGDVGTLWAGDAPYGSSVTRTSVGIGLLAAYPSRAKRLYRADLAIPLTRAGAGGGRLELRFSSEDRTQTFWREPDDVSRARTGTVPTSLFAWPTR